MFYGYHGELRRSRLHGEHDVFQFTYILKYLSGGHGEPQDNN